MNLKKFFSRISIPIFLVTLFIGMLLKIMHWPYGNLIITTSYIFIIAFYFLRFSNKVEKKILDFIKLILVSSFCIHAILRLYHLLYQEIFRIIAFISFLFWITLEGFSYFKQGDNSFKNKLINLSLLIGGALIIIGTLFIIMHWRYGLIILLTGFILSFFYLIFGIWGEDDE